MNARIMALLARQLPEIRRYPGIFLPALLTGATAIALPFVIAIGIPVMTGEPLASSSRNWPTVCSMRGCSLMVFLLYAGRHTCVSGG